MRGDGGGEEGKSGTPRKKRHETHSATLMSVSLPSFSRNELKIAAIHQLKYATDQDFKSIGLSRPELRRLHKFRDKYNSQGYLSKIKRLLQAPKRDEV
jgi:hypothetical protein